MAYTLINAVRDPALEPRRRRYPGKVCRRPVIGDEKLLAARRLSRQDITRQIAQEIAQHVRWGNVQFRSAFGMCADVDVRSVVPGAFTVDASCASAEEVPEKVPVLSSRAENGLKDVRSLFEPEPEEVVIDLVGEGALSGLRNEDLRGVLSILGRRGKGKNKATLVSEIRTAYVSTGLDPVQKRRVDERLTMLLEIR